LYRKLTKVGHFRIYTLHSVREVEAVKYVGESAVRVSLLYDKTNSKEQ